MGETSFEYSRIPLIFAFQETVSAKDTYAGQIGTVALTAQLLKPKDVESNTVVVFMHPIGGGSYLPILHSLAKQGVHVLWCDSRYRGTDSALIMEKVLIDLGECIKSLKDRHGYEKVILGGWSGGGALTLFYQSEAEQPSIEKTPAGDILNLKEQKFIPADGIMLIAAHLSRHKTFTEWIDPSVTEERNPEKRKLEYDIYDSENPNQPAYSSEFLSAYREAQIKRNVKISSWVKERLNDFKRNNEPERELGFVVHRTMADPKWLDSTIDPNDRTPNWCFLGNPETVNNSPIGLARFCSLRSWLSQWSYEDSNGDGIGCARNTSVPTLVIGNTADDAIPPSHTNRLFDAVPHEDKELHWIDKANHYYFGQPEKSEEAAMLCKTWLSGKGLI